MNKEDGEEVRTWGAERVVKLGYRAMVLIGVSFQEWEGSGLGAKES